MIDDETFIARTKVVNAAGVAAFTALATQMQDANACGLDYMHAAEVVIANAALLVAVPGDEERVLQASFDRALTLVERQRSRQVQRGLQ